MRQKRVQTRRTPIRSGLRRDSPLLRDVRDGIGAIDGSHRLYLDASVRPAFADSLDIDAALMKGHEQDHRWDYLLGHQSTGRIVGLEPHSAENSEIATVIYKVHAARRRLRAHLRDGVSVTRWLWVASGKVQLWPMERANFLLAQNGITFVGRRVLSKHVD